MTAQTNEKSATAPNHSQAAGGALAELRDPSAAGLTLASSVIVQLREVIMSGEFAPGSKLRLDDLRDRWGVSLSPLREALSRLSVEGLVTFEDNRGYRVAPVSRNDLTEVTRLRYELESLALEEAIRKGSESWEQTIVASFHTLNKFEQLGRETPEKLERWEVAHRSFHASLLSACDMPLLLQFCTTLHDRSDRYRRIYLQQGRKPPKRDIAREHRDIMDATLARDVDLAKSLLRKNIESTGLYLLSILQASAD